MEEVLYIRSEGPCPSPEEETNFRLEPTHLPHFGLAGKKQTRQIRCNLPPSGTTYRKLELSTKKLEKKKNEKKSGHYIVPII